MAPYKRILNEEHNHLDFNIMAFLILSAAFVAMVAAGGYAPAADNGASYPSGPAHYPVYRDDSYGSYESREKKDHFRKLKDLDADNVFDADITYYKHRGSHYAKISCKQNTDPKKYTWILADSKDKIPSFGLDDTVALAGGINVQYVAKLHNKKWRGNNFVNDDKESFKRVGCLHGDFDAFPLI
ncbi:hypothetical protein L5515_018630 [Caenorhabditis briggsae]|uniref:Uncharacterized protein n=3 Tax=Caenorhabditis briggsae TaxID=6238 RepID=A0AAE9FCU4_CAEBR|nr:hypothetical protein L3Y34_012780 [Caenorhabditis briggsae]UMM43009.1 hypothetical protein L5515_018630 [Caenorhabditis briggsae]